MLGYSRVIRYEEGGWWWFGLAGVWVGEHCNKGPSVQQVRGGDFTFVSISEKSANNIANQAGSFVWTPRADMFVLLNLIQLLSHLCHWPSNSRVKSRRPRDLRMPPIDRPAGGWGGSARGRDSLPAGGYDGGPKAARIISAKWLTLPPLSPCCRGLNVETNLWELSRVSSLINFNISSLGDNWLFFGRPPDTAKTWLADGPRSGRRRRASGSLRRDRGRLGNGRGGSGRGERNLSVEREERRLIMGVRKEGEWG